MIFFLLVSRIDIYEILDMYSGSQPVTGLVISIITSFGKLKIIYKLEEWRQKANYIQQTYFGWEISRRGGAMLTELLHYSLVEEESWAELSVSCSLGSKERADSRGLSGCQDTSQEELGRIRFCPQVGGKSATTRVTPLSQGFSTQCKRKQKKIVCVFVQEY